MDSKLNFRKKDVLSEPKLVFILPFGWLNKSEHRFYHGTIRVYWYAYSDDDKITFHVVFGSQSITVYDFYRTLQSGELDIVHILLDIVEVCLEKKFVIHNNKSFDFQYTNSFVHDRL